MSTTILITGASSGFGKACAEKFAQENTDLQLILIARRADKLKAIAEQLTNQCQVSIATVDIANPTSTEQFFADYQHQLAKVDILINSAGMALGLDPAYKADISDWQAMLATNIEGLLRITHHILPRMVERNSGHIINIGSTAGNWPYPGSNVYGATKAFVQNFSRGLRADLLGKSIRVTNIEPGLAQTNFSNVRFKGNKQQADAVYQHTKPLTAEDIADIIYWVTSLPSHVNVNNLEVMPMCQGWGPLAVDRQMV
jgi:NADP-dependent 3-hydroxy acid dehydrogenase YdfG